MKNGFIATVCATILYILPYCILELLTFWFEFSPFQLISCHWSLSTPPKTFENLWFSVFREYRKRPVPYNGLIAFTDFFDIGKLLILMIARGN